MNLFIFIIIILINIASSNNCNQLVQTKNNKNYTHFQTLLTNFSLDSKCLIRLEPTYLWAQNMSHLFIKFRFSISLDHPICSQIFNFTSSIEYNGFQVSALCIESNRLFYYRLKVITFKSINYNFCNWKQQDLGNKMLECLKSPFPYFWKNLHADIWYRPKNMHIWWQIYRKYKDQIGDFIGLLQIHNEDEHLDQQQKRRIKSKQKLKQYKNEIYFYCYPSSPYDLASWL